MQANRWLACIALQSRPCPFKACVPGRREQRLALAVYGASALLNHACVPTVALGFQGGALRVRALRRLAPGDPLLHCYGPQARVL